MEKKGHLRLNPKIPYYDLNGNVIDARPEYLQTEDVPVDDNWTDIKGYAFMTGYPTENHEDLLARVIQTGSREGDIVLDAFAGSGTTLAVAEKLNRRWIGIDCGKLAIYTIQRRMLNLRRGIGNKGPKIEPKPFTLYNAGLYDFSKLRELPWQDWRFFALQLFQCRDERHKIGGIEFDGYRQGASVMVFNRLLEEGHVELPSQVEIEDVAIDFEQAVTGDHTKFKTKIEHKTYSFEDVAEEMYRRFQSIDEESKDAPDPKDRTQYVKKFPLDRCLEIVKASAKRAKIKTGKITEENRQKILQALGTLRRKSAKRVAYKLTPNTLRTVSTKERPTMSVSAAELRRGDKTIFYTPDCEKTIPDEQKDFFNSVKDPDGDYRAGSEGIPNSYDLKTPCNMVITDWTPERKFIRLLCERDNAQVVEGWLKNSPQRFYAIEYAWKKGEHPKRGDFSPDFFIREGKTVFVVEIKDDGEIDDPSPENQKKFTYACEHFNRLNKWLEKEGIDANYQLNFLTPKDFNKFFIKLRKGDAQGFRSELDIVLGRQSETNSNGN